MDVETAIRTRRTHKQYRPEPLDRATLAELLDLARFAPNHHLTQPWRFRVLGQETLGRLREAAGPKEAAKLDRAPTLVVVSAALTGDALQDEEDLHATACAVYAVLLTATARGLASYWRTPAALRDPSVSDCSRSAPTSASWRCSTSARGCRSRRRRSASRCRRASRSCRSNGNRSAGERNRTFKGRSPPGPKPGASASSA